MIDNGPFDAVGPILVVDDDTGDRELCSRSLKAAFGKDQIVLEAENGERALDTVAVNGLACILLDYAMPGINGMEVLKRVRNKYPFLPVIMIDGKGRDRTAVQSMKEGAQDYMAKSAITPLTIQRAVLMAMKYCDLQKRDSERLNSMKAFTHALAHDLKEPARRIRSFVDRIEDWRNLSQESARSLEHIRLSADRMNAILNSMLVYTDLDLVGQVEMEPCPLGGVVDEVQRKLAPLFVERGTTITVGVLPEVRANHTYMLELFESLLRNAVRHSHHPVHIEVSAEDRGDRWRVIVRDNGPGIAAEDLDAIFQPFTRKSPVNGDGFGLSLAIDRKIAELHEGRIWCESVPGSGATFILELPKPAESRGDAKRNGVEAAVGPKLARILLVDDNDLDLELITVYLIDQPKLHCNRLVARDGKQALAILQQAAREGNPIDLVLLDINMPVMTGFELMAEMHKDPVLRDTMVVMLTTSEYDKDRRMAEALGAKGYIVKPPKFRELKEIVEKTGRLEFKGDGDLHALMRAA